MHKRCTRDARQEHAFVYSSPRDILVFRMHKSIHGALYMLSVAPACIRKFIYIISTIIEIVSCIAEGSSGHHRKVILTQTSRAPEQIVVDKGTFLYPHVEHVSYGDVDPACRPLGSSARFASAACPLHDRCAPVPPRQLHPSGSTKPSCSKHTKHVK